MKLTIEYIIQFLLRCEVNPDWVGYTSDPEAYGKYRIVITPSSFFDSNYGTPESLPSSLILFEGTAVLFGEPWTRVERGTLILGGDLVASAYYMLSSYEEWVVKENRDAHGRYIGRNSFVGRHALLSRPIVDEYGRLLRRLLTEQGVKLPKPNDEFKVTLTHDVDLIAQSAHPRGFLRGIARAIKQLSHQQLWETLLIKLGRYESDPTYTFPWLENENSRLQAQKILFLKATLGGNYFDKPYYDPNSRLGRHLVEWGQAHGYEIGLHGSYASSIDASLYKKECQRLSRACRKGITRHRQHYLVLHPGEQMEQLAAAGLMEDYTAGYADTAGFKLGTCHPVIYINPSTKQLSNVVLHPLIIMEGSLFDSRYMGLSHDAAKQYALKLIETVKEHHGELVLLWHNTAVVDQQGDEATLYHELIDYLRELYHA